MPEPDVILFDFADNDWHITLDGAIQLANTYPQAHLICIHWGSVDAPDMTPFNGNPEDLYLSLIHILLSIFLSNMVIIRIRLCLFSLHINVLFVKKTI